MKIKGLILQARKDFVVDHFGEDAWEQVLGGLPASDQEILKDILLTAKWYSFEIGSRLDEAIFKELGRGNERVFEDIGAKSAQRSLTKIHKSFLTPGDPQAFMRKANVIYKFFYNTGFREYERTGPNSGVITTYESETFSAPDCLTVIGWYKEALKLCGARNIEATETECRAKGGSCCRYSFNWDI